MHFYLVPSQQKLQCRIKGETKLIDNVHQRYFNVNIWLKMKVKQTYVYRHCLKFKMRSAFQSKSLLFIILPGLSGIKKNVFTVNPY